MDPHCLLSSTFVKKKLGGDFNKCLIYNGWTVLRHNNVNQYIFKFIKLWLGIYDEDSKVQS